MFVYLQIHTSVRVLWVFFFCSIQNIQDKRFDIVSSLFLPMNPFRGEKIDSYVFQGYLYKSKCNKPVMTLCTKMI